MNYLLGSKEKFYEFIGSISKDDSVAVLTHNDLDGLASGLFLEKILEAKGIEVSFLDFISIEKDFVKKRIDSLKEEGITKVIFSDLSVDNIDPEGFEELEKSFGVFLIDHHPINGSFRDKDNVLKTGTDDCSALTIFELGRGVFDTSEWEWLVCAAIFSDYSYKNTENFNFLKSIYPEVSLENISSSIPGINSRKIASALIYYEKNKNFVYDLVKKRDLDSLTEVYEIIEDEINRAVEDFSEKKEFYPEKNLYFYEIDSKFNVVSIVTSLISKMKPEFSFVFMERFGDIVKISARNQGGSVDMVRLISYACEGIENASGGGHVPAAAAKIQAKDLEAFKENLLKN
jgi:single-stranded DNA-specific DHH superfamily exonuclease